MRNQILKLAVAQLKEGGYSRLNFATIARVLNITRANIHYHFINKENLGKEAVELHRRDFYELSDKIFEECLPDFALCFSKLEDSLWDVIEENPAQSLCACISLINSPEEVPNSLLFHARKHYDDFIEYIEDKLMNAKTHGFIKDERNPKEIAVEICCLICGFVSMARSETSREGELSGTLKRYAELIAINGNQQSNS